MVTKIYPQKYMRCSPLKVKSMNPWINDFYQDIQCDYRKFLRIFFLWSGVPYGIRNDKIITYVSTEDSRENRSREIGDKALENLIDDFISVFLSAGDESSSCYGLFYQNYKSTGKAKLSKNKKEFILSIRSLSDEELEKKIKSSKQLASLSLSEWREFTKDIHSERDVVAMWPTISERLASDKRTLGMQLRQRLNIQCKRPDDKVYCSILTEMLRRQLRSVKEKCEKHLEDTAQLQEKLSGYSKNKLFQTMCDFGSCLKSINYGLSKRVLQQGVKEAKKKPNSNSKIAVAVEQLRRPEFAELVNADYKILMSAYSGWKLKIQLERRNLYPAYSHAFIVEGEYSSIKDYKMMVGLSSLGSFRLSLDKQVQVSICGKGEMTCSRSRYFGNAKLKELRNACDKIEGYEIKFNHESKSKSAISQHVISEITGVVREIGIIKKGDKWFVSLPYTFETDGMNEFIANRFFQAAKPSKEVCDLLPSEIKVAAFDLNISNVLVVTKATLGRNMPNGNLAVLDYGRGIITSPPTIVSNNGHRCDSLIGMKQDTHNLRDAIKEYKACRLTGNDVCLETKNWLNTITETQTNSRILIQLWVKKLGSDLRQIKYEMRREGYQNLSELIRVLDLMDVHASMIDSYRRIHLKDGQTLLKEKTFDTSRANFRLFILRRIAAAVVKNTIGCNVVFLEDLKSNFDSDNSNNSLARLFSPQTLTNTIEQALQKAGIGVVWVPTPGTSRMDTLTGIVGCRNVKKFSKDKLFVLRDGQLGFLHADYVGSMNVLLLGLSHSVVPYKFKILDRDAVNDKGESPEYKVRLQRYFLEKFGTVALNFFKEDNGRVTCNKIKKGQKQEGLKNTFVYVHANEFVTEEYHIAKQNEIEHLAEMTPNAPEFSVTAESNGTYVSFSM